MLSSNWLYYYSLAKEYYDIHGNLLILSNYVVYDKEESHNLGNWIIRQRRAYLEEKLNQEQIKLLDDINMIWDIKKFKDNTYLFFEMYELGLLDDFKVQELLKKGMFKEVNGEIKKYRYVGHK